MNFKRFALLIINLVITLLAGAQEHKGDTLSLELEKIPFILAVKEIESKTDFFFYYRASDVDTVKVTIHASNVPVSEILDQLISGTNLHYAIDPDKNIFITRLIEITTTLDDNFFSDSTSSNPSATSNEMRLLARENVRGSKVYEIGNKANYKPGNLVTLSGIVKTNDGTVMEGAAVQVEKLKIGIATNSRGYYSLTLPSGRHELQIRSVGMETLTKRINLYGSGVLDVEMQEEVRRLKEVVITAEEMANVKSTSLGVAQLTMKEIKYVPTVFGEADVLRVVLTLPGVKSVGEASTGFNVRGGAADQNLILFNDITIYNPSHFFGFFSAFNPESIDKVELFKSSIPSKYGGRLSSVLQVTGKEGDPDKIKGSAGIGIVTARFNLEGPITKGKTTFLIGGRTTYSNWLFKLLPESSNLRDTKASFNDVNFNVAHRFNEANNLTATGYFSHDESNLNTDTVFKYNNRNISLKWRHDFSPKLSSSFTYGIDHYDYNSHYDEDPAKAYDLDFSVNQNVLKANFSYLLNDKHTLDFGLNSIYYNINPGELSKGSSSSVISPVPRQREQALETALFIEDQYQVGEKLLITGGLRYTIFNYLGAQDVRKYSSNDSRTESNAIDTVHYGKGDFIKTYHGLDFRLAGRYSITKDFSVKLGYTTTHQFIHVLSNTLAISPTDVWKLSDPNIKPQIGQQVSLGLYKNFFSNRLEISIEGYGKKIQNYLDYKSGAKLLANDHVETEVFMTRGKAYGIEAMIRKPKGKTNGWMSYTYSRTLLRTDDPQAGEKINKGKYYPANYDKPHDFTFVGNQKLSRRFSISVNVTYSTGRPITIPVGMYYYGGVPRVLYSDRNSYRIPDYFRSDISINIEGNHKLKQLTHNSWTIGVYNVTGRKNPYSIYFTAVDGTMKGYKLSIFGSAIPFINYNIRF